MAYDFSGSTQSFRLGSAVVTAYPFTMAVWFSPDAASLSGALSVSNNGSSADYIYIGPNASNKGGMRVRDSGGITDTATVNAFTLSTLNLIVARFTSATSRDLVLNADFANKGTSTTSRSPTSINETSIGENGRNAPSFENFNGRCAEPAIWNRVLSDDEVAQLFAKFSPRFIRNGLVFNPPLVRDLIDPVSGGTLTAVGTPTVADHPAIIYPFRPRIITKAAAAGGGALTGSSAATSGATGTLTGNGALSGTSAATSGATGTIANGSAASGEISGISAATSGATATLTAIGALIGSSAVVSNATGTLIDAIGHLSGTISATSGATGTLRDGNPNNIWQAVSAASGTWTPASNASGTWTPV